MFSTFMDNDEKFTNFKNLAVLRQQDFKIMFDNLSTLCMNGRYKTRIKNPGLMMMRWRMSSKLTIRSLE